MSIYLIQQLFGERWAVIDEILEPSSKMYLGGIGLWKHIECFVRQSRGPVLYGTSHAIFAHETISSTGQLGLTAGGSTRFGIGPLTAMKPATEHGPPGGKFLERPWRAKKRDYMRFLLRGGKADTGEGQAPGRP